MKLAGDIMQCMGGATIGSVGTTGTNLDHVA